MAFCSYCDALDVVLVLVVEDLLRSVGRNQGHALLGASSANHCAAQLASNLTTCKTHLQENQNPLKSTAFFQVEALYTISNLVPQYNVTVSTDVNPRWTALLRTALFKMVGHVQTIETAALHSIGYRRQHIQIILLINCGIQKPLCKN